jgi:hypothetical protein
LFGPGGDTVSNGSVHITLLTLAIVTVALSPKAIGMKELAFLTRTGCVNTPKMAHNLDDALKSLGVPSTEAIASALKKALDL